MIVANQLQCSEMASQPQNLEKLFSKLSLAQNAPLVDEGKELECPFTWLPLEGIPRDNNLERCEGKLAEVLKENRKWRLFILNLVLCYEYLLKERTEDAAAKMKAIGSFVEEERSCNKSVKDLSISLLALSYVALACQYFVELKVKGASDTLSRIQEIELTEKDRGAIWGIKAAVYMEYGHEGTKAAVGFCEKAIELDSDQCEWHFLLGKTLSRIRRMEFYNEPPCQRELQALETAERLREHAGYKVFLAQSYREYAFKTFALNRNSIHKCRSECDQMNRRAVALYWSALALAGDSARVNTRCGLGFMKLPRPYQNLEKAKECLLKAVGIAPTNAQTHHALGELYEKMGDLAQAKHHLEVAEQHWCLGAMYSLMRVKAKENPHYNPLPDLEYLLQKYQEKARQYEALCQKGSYWYFIKHNFLEALKSWKIVFEQEPEYHKLKVHRCTFNNMKKPVNLLQVMFDEACLFVDKGLGTAEDRESMDSLISKIIQIHPEFAEQRPILHHTKFFRNTRNKNQTKPSRRGANRQSSAESRSTVQTENWRHQAGHVHVENTRTE